MGEVQELELEVGAGPDMSAVLLRTVRRTKSLLFIQAWN